MKVRSTEFVISAVNRDQYPADGMPEIAFVGRSNVGKSSIINSLLNRRGIARTSQNPGKTRTINFFRINSEFLFADLPGYGYAKVSKTEQAKWGDIMERYLSDRQQLKCICILVDIRHEPKEDDRRMYEWARHFGYECLIIATKSDKISRGQYQKQFSLIRKKLGITGEKIIPVSSLKKTGIDELWKEIEDIFEKNGCETTVE